MNDIGAFIKQKRSESHITQEEFALKSGLGLRFVRELEQGKKTVRLDKVNQALSMFGFTVGPVPVYAESKQASEDILNKAVQEATQTARS
ncbi:helix-turn-helix transcriptional regulator [Treponema sp.]|uniref:helix-turn-helix transcriptional regulator n=1 Tax=Treponema sp. TaxID=166 RepID=UPI00388DD9C3